MNSTWGRKQTDPAVRLLPVPLLFLLLLLGLLAACDARRPKAYITPEVRFNRRSVEMGAPVEVTYTFRASRDFPGLRKDLVVFVHFIDPSGVIRFVDDHTPAIRTNQWKAASEYSYTRTMFIPENIPAGDYIVELGMYTPMGKGERFVLNAKMRSERTYDLGRLPIHEPEVEKKTEYVQGWYDVEREPNNNWYHWQWTSARAVKRMPNPKAPALLYLSADTDRNRFPDDPRVTVMVGNRVVETFPIDSSEPFVKKYRLDPQSLGQAEMVELSLLIDHTFKPSDDGVSTDSRPLGLRVYSFYLDRESD